jgi:hypothetical protein
VHGSGRGWYCAADCIVLSCGCIGAGSSYPEFIQSLHLPAQLAEVDPIVASFCGGAVGVVSALLVVEVRLSPICAGQALMGSVWAQTQPQPAHSCTRKCCFFMYWHQLLCRSPMCLCIRPCSQPHRCLCDIEALAMHPLPLLTCTV